MRIRPVFHKDLVRLNYSVAYQQYFAIDNFTFQRLAIDLGHQYALHSKTRINETKDEQWA